MAAASTIHFDPGIKDYVINNKPLLEHLARHEGVNPRTFQPSVLCQPGVADRLAGNIDPDLHREHVAIYLCAMCGGYDGSPIGVRVSVSSDLVTWDQMGYYPDFTDDSAIAPFHRVTGYSFGREQYAQFLGKLRVHAITEST